MHARTFLSAALVLVLAPVADAGAQQVQLSLASGRATLVATNATPAAILAEWARLGGIRVVDGDRLTGAPLTLRLENVPERQALDIVLRSAAGYIAAARPAGTPGVSAFDRIIVMPVSANAAAARTGPAPATAPMMMVPQQVESVVEMDAQTAEAPVMVDDGSGVEQPVSSTDFDYANPQRYFAARAAQQRAAAIEAGNAPAEATAEVDTGVQTMTGPGGLSTGTMLSQPGTIPNPTPQQRPGAAPTPPAMNPYGLPADAAPGSSTAPPMEPDRAKYINPYAPTPPPPNQ